VVRGITPCEEGKLKDVKLGDNISFEKDGVIHTERIESVHYSGGSPAVYRQLNRWQRFVRRLTPQRWRRSLLVRPARPSTITINDDRSPVGKTLAQLEDMRAVFDRLTEETK
jgi:hypothetical protein